MFVGVPVWNNLHWEITHICFDIASCETACTVFVFSLTFVAYYIGSFCESMKNEILKNSFRFVPYQPLRQLFTSEIDSSSSSNRPNQFRSIFFHVGLHLRGIEQPHSRMPTEQGGTTSVENVNARSGVPLPTPLPSCQTPCDYDAEFTRMESWMDENPEFIQDYFNRFGRF